MKKTNQAASGFDIIPNEILLHIFSFTDLKTVSNLLLVSKRFNSVSKDELKKYYKSTGQEEFGKIFGNRVELKKYCEKLSQEEFGKSFAKSIFYHNVLLFSILKDIADSKDNNLKPDCNWIYNKKREGGGNILEKLDRVFEFWGKSLLYFVIEQGYTELALYLINGIKNDDRYPLSRNKTRGRGSQSKNVTWTKKELINLGYATYESGSNSSSPLTLCIRQRHRNHNIIINSLISLGGEVLIHDHYYDIPSFVGYGETPTELLLFALETERTLRESFYLKQLENLQDQLKSAKEEIKRQESSSKKSDPRKSSKRKREENKKESDSTKASKPQTIASHSIFSKKETDEHHKPAKQAKRPRHGNQL